MAILPQFIAGENHDASGWWRRGRGKEPAALKHLDLKYLGAKIAFGRIPDAADFDTAFG